MPDGSYSVFDIQDYFEFIIKKHEALTENPPIQTYPNKIRNRIVFKVKTDYKLELLSPEIMKLLGSTKKDVDKDKIGEEPPSNKTLWRSLNSVSLYVPNKTLNNVSLERHQAVSMVRLHYVLLERCDDVLKGRNNDVPSVHLHDNSRKSQMKHPTTSQWYVTKTSQDVPLLRLYEVSCKSQMKHLTTLLWYVSTTSGSYVVATDSTFSSYFVMSSIW